MSPNSYDERNQERATTAVGILEFLAERHSPCDGCAVLNEPKPEKSNHAHRPLFSMKFAPFNAVGRQCATCGGKIVIATDGVGCGECGHPHHFECACAVGQAPPVLKPEPPRTRSTGMALLVIGVMMAAVGGWMLVRLSTVLTALGSLPTLALGVPLLGSGWFLIFGAYMAAHRMGREHLKSIPQKTANRLMGACLLATFIGAALLLYVLIVWYPDVIVDD